MSAMILALNERGVPIHWASWQDAVTYKAKGLVVWESGEHDWTKHGGENRITGLTSEIVISSIMAVRGQHFPKRAVPALTNENLFGRDLHICGYCGKEFAAHNLTNDHIVPRSKGGAHSWTNCVSCCRRCNNFKDDLSLEEAGFDLLYVPYVPSRLEAMILRNRNILYDQMDFLRPLLPKHSRLL